MQRCLLLMLAMLFGGLGGSIAEAQDRTDAQAGTFELISVFDHSLEPPKVRKDRNLSCLNLVDLVQRCDRGTTLLYGTRSGVNWDILQIGGKRSRMVKIGKYQLADSFEVPEIKPWRELEPGEKRRISVNTSGADGEHGRNADGTVSSDRPLREGFGDKPVSKQVSSAIIRPDGTEVPDDYTPYMQIKKGNLYAVRVFDESNDFYVLVRVDDLVSGEKAVISVKQIDGPISKKRGL